MISDLVLQFGCQGSIRPPPTFTQHLHASCMPFLFRVATMLPTRTAPRHGACPARTACTKWTVGGQKGDRVKRATFSAGADTRPVSFSTLASMGPMEMCTAPKAKFFALSRTPRPLLEARLGVIFGRA